MTTEPVNDYGSGESGVLIVDRSGPKEPPANVVAAAHVVLEGKHPVMPPPCLDCVPNLILKDSLCPIHREWEWGLLVAHDDTCPALNGVVGRTDDDE